MTRVKVTIKETYQKNMFREKEYTYTDVQSVQYWYADGEMFLKICYKNRRCFEVKQASFELSEVETITIL